MANTLVKNMTVSGGGGAAEGGSHDEGGGGGSPGKLPPEGTPCYGNLWAKVMQLWPGHTIVHVRPDSGDDWLRVSDPTTGYVWMVTGTCAKGYIEIRYRLLQQPGGVRSS